MRRILLTLLATGLVTPAPTSAADDWEPAVANSWESEARRIDEDTIRVSTRKRVAGDLEEINKPGTSVNNAFGNIQQATLLRVALESKNLGFDLFQITGTRNLTTQRDRNRVSGDAKESDFAMAPGHYQAEIELGIQVTADLLSGPSSESLPADVYDANELLIAFGLAELVTSPENPAKP